jgi:hypothetical protein
VGGTDQLVRRRASSHLHPPSRSGWIRSVVSSLQSPAAQNDDAQLPQIRTFAVVQHRGGCCVAEVGFRFLGTAPGEMPEERVDGAAVRGSVVFDGGDHSCSPRRTSSKIGWPHAARSKRQYGPMGPDGSKDPPQQKRGRRARTPLERVAPLRGMEMTRARWRVRNGRTST